MVIQPINYVDDDLGFRHLRHLTMNSINVVPFSIIQRIHTVKWYSADGLSTDSTIYPKVKEFSLKNFQNNSLETVRNLIQHFPNLRSREIQLPLTRNVEYYESLDILLDGIHLPRLLFLKSNWIEKNSQNSKVSLWLSSNTSLKWRSILFCAYHDADADDLVVCL